MNEHRQPGRRQAGQHPWMDKSGPIHFTLVPSPQLCYFPVQLPHIFNFGGRPAGLR
jgi:hypothetical protein